MSQISIKDIGKKAYLDFTNMGFTKTVFVIKEVEDKFIIMTSLDKGLTFRAKPERIKIIEKEVNKIC